MKKKYRTSFLKPVHTLDETAKKLGISKVAVFNIEKKALEKLRNLFNSQGCYCVSDVFKPTEKQNREDCVF